MNDEKDLVLLSYIERIEKLNKDAADISADIKEIYKEAICGELPRAKYHD